MNTDDTFVVEPEFIKAAAPSDLLTNVDDEEDVFFCMCFASYLRSVL